MDGPTSIRTRISSNAFGNIDAAHAGTGIPGSRRYGLKRVQTLPGGDSVATSGFAVMGWRCLIPYTLEVLDPKYRLVGGAVLSSGFRHRMERITPTDTTHWCDTIVFDGDNVEVNAKAMTLINSPSGGAFGTIPFLRQGRATALRKSVAERHAEASVRSRARNGTGMGRKWRRPGRSPTAPRAGRQGHDDWAAHRSRVEQGIWGSGFSLGRLGMTSAVSRGSVLAVAMMPSPYPQGLDWMRRRCPLPALAIRYRAAGYGHVDYFARRRPWR